MKIWVYTLCYNEMKILPYIVKYWEKYADKVIVYDNGSDDGSLEFLHQFDWIEVRDYITDGFNDMSNANIKNNAWKEARDYGVDFVQVSDLDEVIYSIDDVKHLCTIMKENNIDVWDTRWIEVVGENLPTEPNSELYHKSAGFFGNDQGLPFEGTKSKFVLFNPNTIEDSNFTVGSHTASFKKIGNDGIRYMNTENLMYVLHFDKLGLDYLQYKYSKNNARLSDINKRMGWGIQYSFDDTKKKEEIDNLLKNKINIDEL